MMGAQNYLWMVFSFIIVGFLILDLGYFNRKAHKVSGTSAFFQTLFWIALSLGFAALIFFFISKITALEFLSAYVTEKMLSVDNLFVILLLFNFFKLDEKYHHRVLFWGILGAVIFRAIFILVGAYLVHQFHSILYLFGAILIYTGISLFFDKKEEHINFHDNKIFKFMKRFLPFTDSPHNGKFFIWENGKRFATILFMILVLVESTDIIFALDSIPAAFAITQNTFVLFTANVFAIMGLRSLFFLVEAVMHRFHHLQKGLAFVLVFVGMKMLVDIFGIHFSSITSFFVIIGILVSSLVLSLVFPKKI